MHEAKKRIQERDAQINKLREENEKLQQEREAQRKRDEELEKARLGQKHARSNELRSFVQGLASSVVPPPPAAAAPPQAPQQQSTQATATSSSPSSKFLRADGPMQRIDPARMPVSSNFMQTLQRSGLTSNFGKPLV
jgi:hypothetical protein